MAEKSSTTQNMKILGIIFMAFAVWDTIKVILGFFDPTWIGMDVTAFGQISSQSGEAASMVQGVFIFILVLMLVVSLVEFYFGYIAYKERPKKGAAVICLIVGILTLLGVISTITSGGVTGFIHGLSEIGTGLLAILYYYYYKKMNPAG